MKECSRCGVTKPLSEFHSWYDKKYDRKRYQSWCKECIREYQNKGKREGRGKDKSERIVTLEKRQRDVEWYQEKIKARKAQK